MLQSFPTTRASLWRKVVRDLTGQTFLKQRTAQFRFALVGLRAMLRGEGGAKGGSLAQNRDPRQAGLERIEAEPLEQFALIGQGLRRHPPFGVVVGLVQLGASAEAAKGAHW